MAMLEVKNLGISFGGLRAVDGFEMQIEKGQLYGLIGPNGAGKTTVFNMLTGVYKPDDGSIVLDGKDITGKKTIDINKAGIARTFQNIRLFKDQSVLDNVKVGLHNHHTYSTLTGILRLPKYFKVEAEMNEKAMELLKVFGLEDEADYLASNLPYLKFSIIVPLNDQVSCSTIPNIFLKSLLLKSFILCPSMVIFPSLTS